MSRVCWNSGARAASGWKISGGASRIVVCPPTTPARRGKSNSALLPDIAFATRASSRARASAGIASATSSAVSRAYQTSSGDMVA